MILLKQEYWPGENNEIGQVHEDNTKRPIWLQLRKGDLTLSRKGIKEDSLNDVSIYGSADDCEGEILVWFEVISNEDWKDLMQDEINQDAGEYLSEGAAREWSTVVKISRPPPSFNPVSLFLSRSPLILKHPNKSFLTQCIF